MSNIFGGVKFEFLKASVEIRPELCNEFRLFCVRYKELKSNMIDLIGSNTNFYMHFTKTGGKITAQGDSRFNPHRLKGLYLDYRPFAANQEGTNFRYICNNIKKHFKCSEVISLIDTEKQTWQSDDMYRWNGRSFDEITDTYFNAALFHTDTDRQTDLAELTSAFDDLALQSTLLLGVHRKLSAIKNIAFIIGACSVREQVIRVPLSA